MELIKSLISLILVASIVAKHRFKNRKSHLKVRIKVNKKVPYRILQEATKLNIQGSQVCFSNDLLERPNETIKEVCGQIQDSQNPMIGSIINCLNFDTFCNECCNNFIGGFKVRENYNCRTKCKQVQDESATRNIVSFSVPTSNRFSK